jgi:tetratricopeptide (TPR) repeat protein
MKRYLFLALAFALPVLSGGCRPSLTSSALATGISAARADRWEEAIRHWQDALALEPGSAAAHNNLAVAYEKKGAWEEARKEYEAALGLDPANATIETNFERFKARQEAARADKGTPGGGRSPVDPAGRTQ